MEEIQNGNLVKTSSTEAPGKTKLSPSQRKLDEVNAHFARTDMSKLFQLIEEVKSAEKAGKQ